MRIHPISIQVPSVTSVATGCIFLTALNILGMLGLVGGYPADHRPEGIEGTEATAAGSGDRPAEWCGWWMRQHLGGHFGPEYNAARNWLNVGRPLPGPRPGAIGVKEHHVFQVVEVIGPDQVLAISGNDHNAVRTRIRSTAGVIGWRDVTDITTATDSAALKPQDAGPIDNLSAATGQVRSQLPSPVVDGLAW